MTGLLHRLTYFQFILSFLHLESRVEVGDNKHTGTFFNKLRKSQVKGLDVSLSLGSFRTSPTHHVSSVSYLQYIHLCVPECKCI